MGKRGGDDGDAGGQAQGYSDALEGARQNDLETGTRETECQNEHREKKGTHDIKGAGTGEIGESASEEETDTIGETVEKR